MKPHIYKISRIFLFSLVFLICTNSIFAQQGTRSASVSRTRDNSQTNNSYNNGSYNNQYPYQSTHNQYQSQHQYVNSGYAPVAINSNEIAVEEFINYRKHDLPLPKAGEAVALDVRWGNEFISPLSSEAVLQVGFTTSSVNDKQHLPPVNLSIVIDRSGSMADDNKLEKVKAALKALVNELRDNDRISLIVYDDSASVIWPTQVLASRRESLCNVISRIYPGTSTNLHQGLMLGYQEVLRNFQDGATNRVILLTDGIANVGVVDPARIIGESRSFNNKGIDLSTIGVGRDINEDLLRNLAKSGHGLYHFVADSDDIEKTFIKEAQSLVSLVAQKVRVDIDFDSPLQLTQVYGYEPKFRERGVSFTLDNMNHGLTQVIMMRFNLQNRNVFKQYLPVKVTLSYEDVEHKKFVTKTEEATIRISERTVNTAIVDEEVKKNFTIACVSQAIKDTIACYERGNYNQASSIAREAVSRAYERYPSMTDKDIVYVLDILEDYRQKLGLNTNSNSERNAGYGAR